MAKLTPEEKIIKMEEAYSQFSKKMKALGAKRKKLYAETLKKIEDRKIKETMNQISSL